MAYNWTIEDELVGERVVIIAGYGEEKTATVLAVSKTSTLIRVVTDDDVILIGNQWEAI